MEIVIFCKQIIYIKFVTYEAASSDVQVSLLRCSHFKSGKWSWHAFQTDRANGILWINCRKKGNMKIPFGSGMTRYFWAAPFWNHQLCFGIVEGVKKLYATGFAQWIHEQLEFKSFRFPLFLQFSFLGPLLWSDLIRWSSPGRKGKCQKLTKWLGDIGSIIDVVKCSYLNGSVW
jgi:hypothetical protein